LTRRTQCKQSQYNELSPNKVSPSPKQPERQASASIYILHKNSKLAKYAEAANFAYLSKRTISAETPRGFDLTNGPNQKTFCKKANAQ